jgi:hypothetical protein
VLAALLLVSGLLAWRAVADASHRWCAADAASDAAPATDPQPGWSAEPRDATVVDARRLPERLARGREARAGRGLAARRMKASPAAPPTAMPSGGAPDLVHGRFSFDLHAEGQPHARAPQPAAHRARQLIARIRPRGPPSC